MSTMGVLDFSQFEDLAEPHHLAEAIANDSCRRHLVSGKGCQVCARTAVAPVRMSSPMNQSEMPNLHTANVSDCVQFTRRENAWSDAYIASPDLPFTRTGPAHSKSRENHRGN